MLPAMVSDIAQQTPRYAAAPSVASQQDDKVPGQNGVPTTPQVTAKSSSSKGNSAATVDTVDLSGTSLKASSTITKTSVAEAKKLELKKELTKKVDGNTSMGSTSSRVQFVYDQKGTLMVRYMDSANRLIYQVPSAMMLRMMEDEAKSSRTVDTSV